MNSSTIDFVDSKIGFIAKNLQRYPHNYKVKNKAMSLICLHVENIHLLIEELDRLQRRLASDEIYTVENVNQISENFVNSNISTKTRAGVKLNSNEKVAFENQLNGILLDRVVDIALEIGKHPKIYEERVEWYKTLEQCVWIADLITLCLMGICKVELASQNRIVVSPKNVNKEIVLRSIWFGVSTENISKKFQLKDILEFFRVMESQDIGEDKYFEYQAGAITPFFEQWRAGFNSGLSTNIFLEVRSLITTVGFLYNRMYLDPNSNGSIEEKDLYSYSHPILKKNYDDMISINQRLQGANKLILKQNGKISLNIDRMLYAMMALIEFSLENKFKSKSWNSIVFTNHEEYVKQRINGSQIVKLYDGELRNSDTLDNTSIDVDLFAKHVKTGAIYAIQIKQFTGSYKCGLSDWVQFLNKKIYKSNPGKIRKGLDQLKNLRNLIESDEKVRSRLIKIGIDESEFHKIFPILLHNIGTIDYWLDSGVLIYDIGTFCNVLSGGERTYTKFYDNNTFSHGSYRSLAEMCDLTDPLEAIAAQMKSGDYLSLALQKFDLAKEYERYTKPDKLVVHAVGLGI